MDNILKVNKPDPSTSFNFANVGRSTDHTDYSKSSLILIPRYIDIYLMSMFVQYYTSVQVQILLFFILGVG